MDKIWQAMEERTGGDAELDSGEEEKGGENSDPALSLCPGSHATTRRTQKASTRRAAAVVLEDSRRAAGGGEEENAEAQASEATVAIVSAAVGLARGFSGAVWGRDPIH